MADIIITCNAIHAVDVIAFLIDKNIPFSVVPKSGPVEVVTSTPAPAVVTAVKKPRKAPDILKRGPDAAVKARGLRAVLLAGLNEMAFTVGDVRDKCRELGIKPTSAGPTLTYYRRDARFLVQNPDRTYSLTDLGREEALKVVVGDV